jgi:phosphatidylserine decarboxylase
MVQLTILSLQGKEIVQPQPFLNAAGIRLQKWLEPARMSRYVTQRCARFQSPESHKWIAEYAKQYSIDMKEIAVCRDCKSLEECWNKFETLNDFFIRVRTGLPRVITAKRSRTIVSSPADAYTMYLMTSDIRNKVWVKGSRFSVEELFTARERLHPDTQYHLFIFRLAPHHYHRFHSPLSGYVVAIKSAGTEYFSVDPQVVRSKVNVYTRNVRVVVQLETPSGDSVFLAIVGATCVGSIQFSHPGLVEQYRRETGIAQLTDHTIPSRGYLFRRKVSIGLHAELGYFQYGGSTVILCAPAEGFQLSASAQIIRKHARETIETEVRVGEPVLQTSG